MHFDRGRVQGHRFDLDADDLIVLQLREYPIQHAVLRPAVHPRINGVPVAEPLGQTAPFAALLGHIQDRVQHPQIGQAHIAALNRQQCSIRRYCASLISMRAVSHAIDY